MSNRWSVEQVEAVAPTPAAVTAAQGIAAPSSWRSTGADDRAVWGSFQGSGAEPYDISVDHVEVAFRCTCPSRRFPCKHAIALLLLWARDQVPAGSPPAHVEAWFSRRDRAREGSRSGDDVTGAGEDEAVSDGTADELPEPAPPEPDPDRDAARNERVERMYAGLAELDRWLEDRIRTGLADPALARYATWDALAARLVDARAGSLANRVRRLAGLVGASPDWHDDVLAEMGLLHLISQGARRIGSLPSPLADAVATTAGWQVRQADVLGGVPDTERWIVAGRSDTREDRIEVRRHWLRGSTTGEWAMVLSFAAYRQSLDTSLVVGTELHADLHRYPGRALRALVGIRHDPPEPGARPEPSSVAAACDQIGLMLVDAPWLDRLPATVRAAPARDRHGWALTDATGSLPIIGGSDADRAVAVLLSASAAGEVDVTIEWTPHGVVPLAIHLPDRSIDVGPRADPSFVSAA